MAISVLNTNASLAGKTVTVNENADTITGLKTFDRGAAAAPFAVAQATAAVVPNLDADKVDGIQGADLLKKDGTVAMTGKLDLGTIGQVQFPAAQNASADVNCLDDYEEGTFSPTIVSSGGGTPTYSVQNGFYVKIGKLVIVHGQVVLSSKAGLSAGDVSIGGFPFSAAGASAGNIGYVGGMTTSITWLVGSTSGAAINLRHMTAAAVAVSNTTVADISNAVNIVFSVMYST
jgi:hypothetical protein